CFVKNNSVSSWKASLGRELVIGPTAVVAGFTEDSPFLPQHLRSKEEVVGLLRASLVFMFDAMPRAQYEVDKPYAPQH
ncbi:hypothetical protein NPIL_90511, partial [Nephila pilipes]